MAGSAGGMVRHVSVPFRTEVNRRKKTRTNQGRKREKEREIEIEREGGRKRGRKIRRRGRRRAVVAVGRRKVLPQLRAGNRGEAFFLKILFKVKSAKPMPASLK